MEREKKPTYAELVAQVERLTALVAELQAENAELKRRLGVSSRNSHLPPSKDLGRQGSAAGSKKRGSHRLTSKGRKKVKATLSGSAKSASDETSRKRVAPAVTSTQTHWPLRCEGCGAGLEQAACGEAIHKDVFELREAPVEVHRHVLEQVRCGCGHRTRAQLPAGIAAVAHLGPRATAAIGWLLGPQRSSRRDCRDLLWQMWRLPVSLETLSAVSQYVGEALSAPHAQALAASQASRVVHADETGWFCKHQRHWLWTIVSEAATVFRIDARRNKAAAAALLGNFDGVLVSDRYGAYTDQQQATWQLCLAHLTRDLVRCWETPTSQASYRVGQRSLAALKGIFTQWHRYKDGKLSRATLKRRTRRYRAQLLQQLRQGRRADQDPRLRNFCKRLLSQRRGLFYFLDHEGVEPTNNIAERALRRAVQLRHTSLGTQLDAGNRFVERILSVHATLRARGLDGYLYLVDAVRAFSIGTPVPAFHLAA